jgi:hypothetical protein
MCTKSSRIGKEINNQAIGWSATQICTESSRIGKEINNQAIGWLATKICTESSRIGKDLSNQAAGWPGCWLSHYILHLHGRFHQEQEFYW